jgi:hypothetical protein
MLLIVKTPATFILFCLFINDYCFPNGITSSSDGLGQHLRPITCGTPTQLTTSSRASSMYLLPKLRPEQNNKSKKIFYKNSQNQKNP